MGPGGWKLRWSARGRVETKTQTIPVGPPVPSFVAPAPLTFAIDSLTTPVWSAQKQHSSPRAAQTSPCWRKIKSNPLLFYKTTSDKEVRDFSKWLIDSSMQVISASIAAHREENPWPCRDSEAIPVPAPASPRLNKAAMMIALIGSLFFVLAFPGPNVST